MMFDIMYLPRWLYDLLERREPGWWEPMLARRVAVVVMF